MKKKILLISLLQLAFVMVGLSQEEFKKITLDDIFRSNLFSADQIAGITPMADGEHYLLIENDSINIYRFKNGKFAGNLILAKVLIPEGDSIPINFHRYQLSQDEKLIMFATATESIYRRSSKSYYYIYSIANNDFSPLSENGKQQHATFSPDGQKVIFVRENNIYLYDIKTSTELQITNDGEKNKIINGSTDWVYEEEFGFSKAFFWSPDSKKIAFYSFDESRVKEFTMMMWGDLYPDPYTFKYPKAGEANAVIDIKVYDLETQKTTKMHIGEKDDIYIPRIQWTCDSDLLSIQWMNRLQNELKILLAEVSTGKTQTIYHEKNDYYIDITDDLTFLKDNNGFIFTSEQDGYNHIYLYDILGNLEQQITHGKWMIDELIGVDEEKEWIYFTSTETSPLNRELYRIQFDGSNKQMLSEKKGTNKVNFAPKYKYYINTWSDAKTPPVISVHNAQGKKLRTLVKNHELKNRITNYGFTEKEFFNFTTTDSILLNGWMIKPPNFDSAKKYPILMYVYGGPGSQTVLNSWNGRHVWYQMLAQQGIIIVSVDNRGTGGRGEYFKKLTYLQLGKYETIDQIETAKYLESLPYVDSNKIGIWGWSYGGFMAANCLTQGTKHFSMAISVAPVTSWRYYDNIYTERFMRTPQENPDGYDNNSLLNHVNKLDGKFLLIHGTADDNVHVQNSIDLATALVKADKQFDMQFYPNSNHGIYTGKNTRYHLYSKMTQFIYDNLLKNEE